MSESERETGPKLVWTFPLIRRIQNGPRIIEPLNLESGLTGMIMKRRAKNETESGNQTTDSNSSNESQGSGTGSQANDSEIGNSSSDSRLEVVESQINKLKESDSMIDVSSPSEKDENDNDETENTGEIGEYQAVTNEDNKVVIENGVFIPTRLKIDEGEEVTWVNNSESTHRVMSVTGEEFMSDTLEEGEKFTHQFNTTGVTIYQDSIEGAEEMSGAIIVGDADAPETLPSESDIDPVPLDEDDMAEDAEEGENEQKESGNISTP